MAVSADITHTAWQVAGSYVLTGEAATDRGVRPRYNFDPAHEHIGAIQVAVRYHALEVDEDAIVLGLATPGSTPKATAVTFGINWYPDAFIKCVFNVERTRFLGDARPAETGFVLRAVLFLNYC